MFTALSSRMLIRQIGCKGTTNFWNVQDFVQK